MALTTKEGQSKEEGNSELRNIKVVVTGAFRIPVRCLPASLISHQSTSDLQLHLSERKHLQPSLNQTHPYLLSHDLQDNNVASLQQDLIPQNQEQLTFEKAIPFAQSPNFLQRLFGVCYPKNDNECAKHQVQLEYLYKLYQSDLSHLQTDSLMENLDRQIRLRITFP